jgi:uncharacterized membrane protein YidH (DUF202 family)
VTGVETGSSDGLAVDHHGVLHHIRQHVIVTVILVLLFIISLVILTFISIHGLKFLLNRNRLLKLSIEISLVLSEELLLRSVIGFLLIYLLKAVGLRVERTLVAWQRVLVAHLVVEVGVLGLEADLLHGIGSLGHVAASLPPTLVLGQIGFLLLKSVVYEVSLLAAHPRVVLNLLSLDQGA